MKHHASRIVAPLLLLAGHTHAQSFTLLGTLPGSDSSRALAMSDDGSVIVGHSGTRPFRWTAAGGMQPLTTSTAEGIAYATNADGSVVVGHLGPQAFRWTASGGLQLLGLLPGSNAGTRALAVSADGSVVAGDTDESFAFRWTQSTGVQRLNPGVVFGDLIAAAVSRDGTEIYGWTRWDLQGCRHFSGTRWDASGAASSAGFGRNQAVSPGGLFATTTELECGNTYPRAARWGPANMLTLGTLPGDLTSAAYDISDDAGILVGESWPTVTSTTGRAFIYSESIGIITNLTDHLTSRGINLMGWTITGARAISADGNVIAGFAVDPLNRTEAFVATLCYANCDSSTASPRLNVADFVCFLNSFATGSRKANCDHSTAFPVLTVNDFTCFSNKFAAGCE